MPSTVGIVASAVWTPLDLSPALWLDAADTATITESGGFVSQWNDKSGNGRNVAQATGVNQPTTNANTLNGLNVLDFDGNDRLVAATASDWTFLHTSKYVVFAVFRAGNVADPEAIYVVWGTSVTVALPTGAFLAHDTRSSSPRNDALVHVVGPGAAQFRVLHVQQNQLSGNVWAQTTVTGDIANATVSNRSTIRLNGGSDLTGTWPGAIALNTAAPRNPFAVGASLNNSNVWDAHLVGAVAEIIVVNGTITAQQQTDTETYLASKWAI